MAKYDLERFLDDIEALMQAQLNTKIAAINTEKNDSIVLKTIDSSAYFFQELNGKQINCNPFILYGVESSQSQSIRGASLEDLVVSVVIVVQDAGEDITIAKRMIRYRRALREVFEENYLLFPNASNLEIQSLVPVAFDALNSQDSYRVVGVNLSSTLG